MSTYPQEHDARLLELYGDLAKADQKRAWAISALQHDSRPAGVRFSSDDRRSLKQVLIDHAELCAELTASGERPWRLQELERSIERYNVETAKVREIEGRIAELEMSYAGWQRYWLVVSSAGLVHASRNCSTCNKGRSATRFALVAAMSGLEVSHLVEAVGPFLCSVCFPSAPVEWQEQDRVPARVAEVLLDKGYDAFQAEWTEFKRKREVRAAKKAARS